MIVSTKTALIVDDSASAQLRLKKMLRPYGLHIDTATSGEAALHYLSSKLPDVIFMDHLMPGMDGLRALQIIKSRPQTAVVPVVMYTAQSGDLYLGQARALGALDVVSKDTINATELSKVMRAIHLFPATDSNTADSKAGGNTSASESPALIAAANQVSGNASTKIAPEQSALSQQLHTLELRLASLELAQQDSRRFITSRLVRELQSLRQQLLPRQPQPAINTPTTDTPTTPEPRRTPWLPVLLLALLLLLSIYQLSQLRQLQQGALQPSQTVLNTPPTVPVPLPPATAAGMEEPLLSPLEQHLAQVQQPEPPHLFSDPRVLDELAWAFNQSGSLPFAQNRLDPASVVRVHEFISRLLEQGFVGGVTIYLSIGNFCLTLDGVGQAALAPPDATLSDCLLSHEAYNLERVSDNYRHNLEDAFTNLQRRYSEQLSLSIRQAPSQASYPEQLPQTNAGQWNDIAQRNNLLYLHLEPL